MAKRFSKQKKEAVVNTILSKILLVTFTDAAAKQMRERLIGAFKEEGIDVDPSYVNAVTFNAIYMDLIVKFYKELGYKKVPTVIDVNPTALSAKVLPLITGKNEIPGLNYRIPVEFFAGRRGGMGALTLSLTVFELIRSNNIDPNDPDAQNDLTDILRQEGLYQKMSDQSVQVLLQRYNTFLSILKDEGFITFADQEPLAIQILDNHPDYLKSLGIEHVVVDEFQDSNDYNMEFVRRLADCMDDTDDE